MKKQKGLALDLELTSSFLLKKNPFIFFFVFVFCFSPLNEPKSIFLSRLEVLLMFLIFLTVHLDDTMLNAYLTSTMCLKMLNLWGERSGFCVICSHITRIVLFCFCFGFFAKFPPDSFRFAVMLLRDRGQRSEFVHSFRTSRQFYGFPC